MSGLADLPASADATVLEALEAAAWRLETLRLLSAPLLLWPTLSSAR